MDRNLHSFGEDQPFFPIQVSDEAQAAVINYRSRIKRGEDEKRKEIRDADVRKSLMLFRDFCGEDFDDKSPIYDVMRLAEVTEEMHNEFVKLVSRTVLENYVKPNERTEYVFGLLRDLQKINAFWRNHSSVSMEDIYNLLETINLESVLIRSAQSLAFMHNRLPLPDNSVQEIDCSVEMQEHMAISQTLLAPICEIIGYDGLAMALNSAAYQAALRRDHQPIFIDESRKILDELPEAEQVQDDIHHIVGALLDGDSIGDTAFPAEEQHGILFGYGYYSYQSNGGEPRTGDFVYRQKSVGALAKKLQRGIEKYGRIRTPRDIIGVTLIADDPTERLQIFKRIVDNASQLDDRGRGEIKIIGSNDFVEDAMSSIAWGLDDDTSMTLEPPTYRFDDYQSAKIYILHNGTQFEIQTATRRERDMNRYGSTAHALRRSEVRGEVNEDSLRFMQKIHDRREHIGDEKLNPATVEAGRMLINYVKGLSVKF